MTIQAAEKELQTELQVESREEQLTRLFKLDTEIEEIKNEKEKYANMASSLTYVWLRHGKEVRENKNNPKPKQLRQRAKNAY